jgi:CheY-like chemotaxis protein
MGDLESVEILLVEDTDADAEMTARALRKANIAAKLLRVRDGVEALEFVLREGIFRGRGAGQPRLILLDLKMPKLGGIEVLRRLKAADATRFIPVVVLTSSAEERDISESYRLGANSYLVKPVSSVPFADLIARAAHYWALLNRAPARRGPAGGSA